MKLFDQEGIWKTQLHGELCLLIHSHLKQNPRIITCKILDESSVARFPANKFLRAH